MERDEVVEYIERNDSDDEFDEVRFADILTSQYISVIDC